MKCPKCGYVGFESVERCRNCGYHFALTDVGAVDVPSASDGASGGAGETPLRPDDSAASEPIDPAFELPPRTPVAIETRPPLDDLPLFGVDDVASTSPVARLAAAPAPAILTPPTPVRLPAAAASRVQRPGEAARGRSREPERGGKRGASPRQAAEPKPASLDLEPSDTLQDLLTRVRTRKASAPQVAGPLARAMAGLVDALVLGGIDLTVLYFTLRVCRLTFGDVLALPVGPLVGFYLLLDGAYLVAFTANGGQTIGKMAAGIRVVGDDGSGVTAGQALIRAGGYLASALPAGLGFVPGLFGPVRRALHDRLANTRVIRAS